MLVANATVVAFFLVFMGLLCFIYMIASIRTNIVFFGIFANLVVAFGLLSAAFWQFGMGNAAFGGKLQIVSCLFLVSEIFSDSTIGWRRIRFYRINARMVFVRRPDSSVCRLPDCFTSWRSIDYCQGNERQEASRQVSSGWLSLISHCRNFVRLKDKIKKIPGARS
jgi:hypothetical protein